MNAEEFATEVEQELLLLGPYRLDTDYSTLPAVEASEIAMVARRDPHHGETDFYTDDRRRFRRVAAEGGGFVEIDLDPDWCTRAVYFEHPWPEPEKAAATLDNAWVASRARKKLGDWHRQGYVTLDEPVEGFTRVSLLQMAPAMNIRAAAMRGFQAARAAHAKLEEQRRLASWDESGLEIDFRDNDVQKKYPEMHGEWALKMAQYIRPIGCVPILPPPEST